MKRAVWRLIQWRKSNKSQKMIATVNKQVDK